MPEEIELPMIYATSTSTKDALEIKKADTGSPSGLQGDLRYYGQSQKFPKTSFAVHYHDPALTRRKVLSFLGCYGVRGGEGSVTAQHSIVSGP